MTAPSPDDELAILLPNLRNAAAAFGEGTPPYESIRTTIEEHVNSMKAAGVQTNLTGLREGASSPSAPAITGNASPIPQTTFSFANLVLRPKPNR